MSELHLQDRNALGARPAIGGAGRLTVTVAADRARFVLRLADGARERAGAVFGCPLPGRSGGLAVTGERLAACLGPDEWFLLAPSADAAAIAARFAAELGEPHSLVDVSHREVGIELAGPGAALALNAGCALDLSTRPTPWATRTLVDKAQVVLLKLADDHYRLEVWPSFAEHVWGLLEAAGREIALDI